MKKLTSIFALFVLFFSAFAGSIPELTGRVVDNAGILSPQQIQEIARKSYELEQTTGIQLAVLTIPSLNGQSIDVFATEVAQSWGLGNKDRDDGILITMALKERMLRIDVGYGLNPVLTATKTGIIRREYMNPYFKAGDYARGLEKGIDAIAGYVCEDENIKTDIDKKAEKEESSGNLFLNLLPILIFVFIATTGSGIGPFGLWWIYCLLTGRKFTRMRSKHDDDWNHRGGGSGRGGFFGGGGGGFSGGGGHFGGGGSSGRW